jgi:hypothetical protein
MKIFLSSQLTDTQKGLSSLPNQSYEELLLKYRRAFPDFYDVRIFSKLFK